MENAYKRRLRGAKCRIVSMLMLAGYEAYSFSSGPFHVCADGYGTVSKRIRIAFGAVSQADRKAVSDTKVSRNCRKEIWIIDRYGTVVERVVVS